MKLPNGYGSISKLSGKRRCPYWVYITDGWDENGKQIRKTIGYVKSRTEGLKLLADYHGNPYNLDYRNLTFSYIWENGVLNQLEVLVEQGKMSESNLKGLSSVYKNHCKKLYNDILLELKYKKMQTIIDDSDLGYTAKGNIKTVCKKIFDCAINEYELPIANNPADKLKVGEKKKSDKHTPFTVEELSILWGLQYNDIVKLALIFAYSGTRPNEVFTTEKNNIFIEDNYFITGSKTEAGKDRIIPIHPKIKHLMEYFYDKENDYPFTSIIDKFNYGKFKRRFDKLMNELNFNHTPYDGRHTFITKMKDAGADEYILKRIVGHSITDITEKIYTHRNVEKLYNEILKID